MKSQTYRAQPLVRLAKVYQFPVQQLTYEQEQALQDEQAIRNLREKMRLEANQPAPWYKDINPLRDLFTDAEDYIPPIKRSWKVEAVKVLIVVLILAVIAFGAGPLVVWLAEMVVKG